MAAHLDFEDEEPTRPVARQTMDALTRETPQSHVLAKHLGRRDGAIRAIVMPFDCDPSGGFIRRVVLNELQRDVYITAYVEAFEDKLKRQA